jgi:hypothetical protein
MAHGLHDRPLRQLGVKHADSVLVRRGSATVLIVENTGIQAGGDTK